MTSSCHEQEFLSLEHFVFDYIAIIQPLSNFLSISGKRKKMKLGHSKFLAPFAYPFLYACPLPWSYAVPLVVRKLQNCSLLILGSPMLNLVWTIKCNHLIQVEPWNVLVKFTVTISSSLIALRKACRTWVVPVHGKWKRCIKQRITYLNRGKRRSTSADH